MKPRTHNSPSVAGKYDSETDWGRLNIEIDLPAGGVEEVASSVVRGGGVLRASSKYVRNAPLTTASFVDSSTTSEVCLEQSPPLSKRKTRLCATSRPHRHHRSRIEEVHLASQFSYITTSTGSPHLQSSPSDSFTIRPLPTSCAQLQPYVGFVMNWSPTVNRVDTDQNPSQ